MSDVAVRRRRRTKAEMEAARAGEANPGVNQRPDTEVPDETRQPMAMGGPVEPAPEKAYNPFG